MLADLFFPKMWLARRFTVPGCEAVCCDGNAPLPFARGVFGLAMCSDAFQYIWTKRQFIDEMAARRGFAEAGAVLISHTHNQLAWSPSHGQPLSPAGYRDLFETIEPRIFGEAGLFEDVVSGSSLDLTRRDAPEMLDRRSGTDHRGRHTRAAGEVWKAHQSSLGTPRSGNAPRGRWRINPLYSASPHAGGVRLKLRFPTPDYEDEYGACRRYLPKRRRSIAVACRAARPVPSPPPLAALARQRVVLELPERYY